MLSPDKRWSRQECWFVDCYRMRVNDEIAYQGKRRGLYKNQKPNTIVKVFYVLPPRLLQQGSPGLLGLEALSGKVWPLVEICV